MNTGVGCDDACQKAFNDMKLKHNVAYLIFSIKDKKTIVIEKTGEKLPSGASKEEKEAKYKEFCDSLPPAEPKYAVVDFAYETTDGRPQDKLVFVFWSPDDSKTMLKMLYAGSKDTIKKQFNGVHQEIQANDNSDLDFEEVKSKCLKV